MSSPFQAPPAGTEVPPSSDTRYFYRRQHFSRNPVTEGNWQGGKTVNITAEASGGHYLVPSECRIVQDTPKSSKGTTVRFATDPIHTGMFSAGICLSTARPSKLPTCATSRLCLRMDNTRRCRHGRWDSGLLVFTKDAIEEHLSPADFPP